MPTDENVFARIWREERLSCLSRATLGGYLLGTLSPELRDYVEFHLNVLNCPYCRSNLDDMREEAESMEASARRKLRLYESSVGYLKPGP